MVKFKLSMLDLTLSCSQLDFDNSVITKYFPNERSNRKDMHLSNVMVEDSKACQEMHRRAGNVSLHCAPQNSSLISWWRERSPTLCGGQNLPISRDEQNTYTIEYKLSSFRSDAASLK